MVLLLMTVDVQPGKRREFRQTVDAIVSETRTENGCEAAAYYQHAGNANEFLLVEHWRDRDTLDLHLRSDRFTVLLGTKSLLCKPPEIVLHRIASSSGLNHLNVADEI